MSQDSSNNNNPSDPTLPLQYDRMLVVLHWVLAIGLFYQLGLGLWMEDIPKDPPGVRAEWFNLHKSIGMCLGILILWRLGWRISHSVPAAPIGITEFQNKLSRWAHRILYLCMLLLPLSGFMGSNFSQYPIKFFGFPLPKLWDPSPEGKELFSEIHEVTAFVMMIIIILHISAAVWHQWVKRDGLLSRMGWSR
jgi:cytochrome b561